MAWGRRKVSYEKLVLEDLGSSLQEKLKAMRLVWVGMKADVWSNRGCNFKENNNIIN